MTKEMTSPIGDIAARILVLRGQRVLMDSDLAAMYGVSTRRFNEQVRRNESRFPADFGFVLTVQELANLKSQIATSSFMSGTHGGKRKLPRVFTEHGALMAATLLNSPRAIQMSVYVVRAFVRHNDRWLMRPLRASARQWVGTSIGF